MTKRLRFTDPLRRIVKIEAVGACDLLTFECGHTKLFRYRARWGQRARCNGCRVWND